MTLKPATAGALIAAAIARNEVSCIFSRGPPGSRKYRTVKQIVVSLLIMDLTQCRLCLYILGTGMSTLPRKNTELEYIFVCDILCNECSTQDYLISPKSKLTVLSSSFEYV